MYTSVIQSNNFIIITSSLQSHVLRYIMVLNLLLFLPLFFLLFSEKCQRNIFNFNQRYRCTENYRVPVSEDPTRIYSLFFQQSTWINCSNQLCCPICILGLRNNMIMWDPIIRDNQG